jgi:hypothetical protein
MPPPVEEDYDSSVDDDEIENEIGEFDYDNLYENNPKKSQPKNATDSNKDKNEPFLAVISDMVISGQADGHSSENLLMEIKGYKFAQNKVHLNYLLCLSCQRNFYFSFFLTFIRLIFFFF